MRNKQSALFDRQLNLGQPLVDGFLVPDAVNVALAGETRHLVPVVLSVLVDECVRFAKVFVGALVVNAQNLGLGD